MRLLPVLLAILLCAVRPNPAAAQNHGQYIRNLGADSPVIVFVHGILGDSISSWTNNQSYWPRLLLEDKAFDGVSVYAHDYESSLRKPGLNITELAKHMRSRLNGDDVSKHKEIIFLAHSLGGIIVRDYLLGNRDIASKTRFTYFFSTPSTGATIAEWAQAISGNIAISELDPARSEGYLAQLHSNWLEGGLGWMPAHCAYERDTVLGAEVVSRISAVLGCNQQLDPIPLNHIDIVKPEGRQADSYVAFLNAFRAHPAKKTELPTNCRPDGPQITMGSSSITVPALSCAAAEKSYRIKYVWLDSVSASLLVAGKIKGELSKVLGETPYVLPNRVNKEMTNIIEKFGRAINRSPQGNASTRLSIPSKEINGTSTDVYGEEPAHKVLGKSFPRFLIYDDSGEVTPIPDITALLHIQNNADYPSNYDMCYTEPDDSTNPIDFVNLWRYLTKEDVLNYRQNTAHLRDLYLRRKVRPHLGRYYGLTATASLPPPASLPTGIRAVQYFTRNNWPLDFAIVMQQGLGCTEDARITFKSPQLFLLVGVLENLDRANPLRVLSFESEFVDNYNLRSRSSDSHFVSERIQFPPGAITSGETIVIPLEIELRDKSFPRGADLSKRTDSEVAGRPQVFTKKYGTEIWHRKKSSAFREPKAPAEVRYTYGPRVRLTAFETDELKLPLRQFDPSQLFAHFGFNIGSCPTVYVRSSTNGELVPYGKVLTGASKPSLIKTDTIFHDGPAENIELVEEEPEIATIASLQVFATDKAGNEQLILTMMDRAIAPGMPLRVSAPEMRQASHIRVEVTGFYQPLPGLLHSHQAVRGTHNWDVMRSAINSGASPRLRNSSKVPTELLYHPLH
jgi:pimeloyl-ACP methyl ester carboxylesterase